VNYYRGKIMKKLGFGFMRLPLRDKSNPASIDFDTLNKMVDVFIERGFSYFDTAYPYHNQNSEIALRETVVKRYPRESFALADKMPSFLLKTKNDQIRIFSEQLERCGVDYFDYYLVHNLTKDNYKPVQKFDTFAYLEKLKEEGKIKQLGFSFHDSADFLEEILSDHSNLDFVQLQINYADWDSPNIQSKKCYEVARKYNKAIIAMEPVKGGLLADVPESIQNMFRKIRPDQSIPSWAIRYAASLDGIMMVLSGMSDMMQLDNNTGFMINFEPLSEEEAQAVEKAKKIINDATAISCTACRYCVETCPQSICIPDYFALYNSLVQLKKKNNQFLQRYYSGLSSRYGNASACIACGACVEHCPQHIDIPHHLKEVAKVFEG